MNVKQIKNIFVTITTLLYHNTYFQILFLKIRTCLKYIYFRSKIVHCPLSYIRNIKIAYS